MLRCVLQENRDVVQVAKDGDIEHIAEHIIHKILKGCGSVSKAEWHNKTLTIGRAKRGLVTTLVTLFDAH